MSDAPRPLPVTGDSGRGPADPVTGPPPVSRRGLMGAAAAGLGVAALDVTGA